MSDNNDTNLLPLDPNNAWGLNIVNAQYAKEASQINQSLQTLMNQLANSVAFSAEALYKAANAILLGSVYEALGDVAGAGSALYVSRDTQVLEKKYQEVENESKNITKKLQDPKLTDVEKKKLDAQQGQNKSKLEKARQDLENGRTKANIKMNVLVNMGSGLKAIPKGMQDSLQQKDKANSDSYSAVKDQTSATYQTQESVLKGFLDVNYFAGVVTISGIQLR